MAKQTNDAANTYFVDPDAYEEFTRLMRQERLVTRVMGGLLAERGDLSAMHRVLDMACGPGGWVLGVAAEHPQIEVVGVDISETALRFAALHAQERHLRNASFRHMNILEPLDFPDQSFDLVNARFLVAVVPREYWPVLLAECVRVLRPGGILRLTEGEANFTSSPALNTFFRYFAQALSRAGMAFSLDGTQFNITTMLVRLLRQAGCRDIGRRAHVNDFSAGEPAHAGFFEPPGPGRNWRGLSCSTTALPPRSSWISCVSKPCRKKSWLRISTHSVSCSRSGEQHRGAGENRHSPYPLPLAVRLARKRPFSLAGRRSELAPHRGWRIANEQEAGHPGVSGCVPGSLLVGRV